MDNSPGMKFGDLRKEEHFKRLERNLKLNFVKQMEQIKAAGDKSTSPGWPSMSSINPDTSCDNKSPQLYDFRGESEVVSSSNNLRKLLHQKMQDNRKPMATSSVKRFPVNDSNNDRVIMPPPSINNLKIHNARKQSNFDSKRTMEEQYSKKRDYDTETDSAIKTDTYVSIINQETNSSISKLDSHSTHYFSRWRVLLNDRGQLIIKGTLECGKIARSKPILQRISCTELISVFKHVYILQGNIVDERNELPDYVRGKFHNGFPDDWENVHQIWQHYVVGGSKITFRWPTPVTDSDDDLNSEITDFVPNNASSSGYHSKTSSLDNEQNSEQSKEKTTDGAVTKQDTVKKLIIDENLVEIKDECTSHVDNVKNISNSSNFCNSNSKTSNYLSQIIKEDKLLIIRSNLADENCPSEYFDKFIELIDNLRYILSRTPSNNSKTDSRPNFSPEKIHNQGCQNCNNVASFSETQETNPESLSNNNQNNNKISKETDNIEQKDHKKRNDSSDLANESGNSSSDSEMYMGIPNVSLNHIIKSKVSRSDRYRDIKNRSKEKKHANKSDQIDKNFKFNKKLQRDYDSSLSITEDEYEKKCRVKNKNKNSMNEDIQQDKSKVIEEKIRPKPVIKSCEEVNINLKTKLLSKNATPVDTKSSNLNKHDDDLINDGSEVESNDEIIDHPFLSHDLNDNQNEKDTDLQVKVPINSKSNDQNENNEEEYSKQEMDHSVNYKMKARFGSKLNPKLLTSWVPCLMYNNSLKKKYYLVFEGRLLNEAGHILQRKFVTDPICTRHSSRLIETENNEYFMLTGEVNTAKHSIPKNLIKQCRTGCPPKIKEFCEEWIKLSTDERARTKVEETVYTSENIQERVSKQKIESSRKTLAPNEKQEQKSSNSEEPRAKTIKNSTKPLQLENNNILDVKNKTSKRVAQQLVFISSSGSDGSEVEQQKNIGKSGNSGKVPNSNSPKKYMNQELKMEQNTEKRYNTKLRKRQKFEDKENPYNRNLRSTTRKQAGIVWSYEKNLQNCDMLSDDEASVINK